MTKKSDAYKEDHFYEKDNEKVTIRTLRRTYPRGSRRHAGGVRQRHFLDEI